MMTSQPLETPQRIEPALLDTIPEAIVDEIAELRASTAVLGRALHPLTAASLSGLVRIMNTYYSNLIEGHNTRPKDIVRALGGDFERDPARRNLQWEAASHVRVQSAVDLLAAEGRLPDPVSSGFLRDLHRDFYQGAPAEMLTVHGPHGQIIMVPGVWRSSPDEDVAVGRHLPPSSRCVPDFMNYFADRYRHDRLGASSRIVALAAAHHRFNYIHPFPDGNGRVSRLMSHALAHAAGIGAHGLWSISRGLARGLESRTDYKRMMDYADTPRQGDRDGRGNLSEAALEQFILWFLRVCNDQVAFMSDLFDFAGLVPRLHRFVERRPDLKSQAGSLLEMLLIRGDMERGSVAAAMGLPERTARRVLGDLLATGIVASPTVKGRISLSFPIDLADELFPRLFPEA